MSIRFDLTDLRLFVHVAEVGSITHGATRANMALASASERIRAMEEALGAPLLERKRRGVRLTAVFALVHHARIVTQQLEQMRGELSDYAKGLRGHVRLLSNTVGIAELLPTALAAFLRAHPNIDVELEDRPSRGMVRAIAEGLADSVLSRKRSILLMSLRPFRSGHPPRCGRATSSPVQPTPQNRLSRNLRQ